MNVVLFEPAEIGPSDIVTVRDARASHLLNVLRVSPGDRVRVGLVDGPLGVAAVESIGEGTVALRCAFENQLPPRPPVDLLLALPRPKVLRRLWPQLAALGVGRIILSNAERVERNYFDTHVISADCYRPLLIEGLQQARDTRVPEVLIHRQFKILVEDHLDTLFADGVRLVADPIAPRSAADVLADRSGQRVLLAVGPEGGWNAFELALLDAHGFQSIGMGARRLRTDTACIALLALVHDAIKLPESPRAPHRPIGLE